MKRRGKTIILCLVTIIGEMGGIAILISPYAVSHWWTPDELNMVVLVGLLVMSAGASLAIGYASSHVWPALACQVILGLLIAVPLAGGRYLMQGLHWPTAVSMSLILGWIGAKLRILADQQHQLTAGSSI